MYVLSPISSQGKMEENWNEILLTWSFLLKLRHNMDFGKDFFELRKFEKVVILSTHVFNSVSVFNL
jgi:hypothetical protein